MDSADGDVGDSVIHQHAGRGGDAVASGNGGLRGRRSIMFEFHRMSSYRHAPKFACIGSVSTG
jgi:hypothetical protein